MDSLNPIGTLDSFDGRENLIKLYALGKLTTYSHLFPGIPTEGKP
jgi:hypothetical protein